MMRKFAFHSVDCLILLVKAQLAAQEEPSPCALSGSVSPSPSFKKRVSFWWLDLQPAHALPAEQEVHISSGLWPGYAASAIVLSRRGEEPGRHTFRPDFEISRRIYNLIVKRSVPPGLFEHAESP